MGDIREQLSEYSRNVKQKVENGLDTVYSQVLTQPKTTLVLMIILSAYLGNIGTNFQDQIVDDVEIFLPIIVDEERQVEANKERFKVKSCTNE